MNAVEKLLDCRITDLEKYTGIRRSEHQEKLELEAASALDECTSSLEFNDKMNSWLITNFPKVDDMMEKFIANNLGISVEARKSGSDSIFIEVALKLRGKELPLTKETIILKNDR